MIEFALLAMMQAASADRIAFACENDRGVSFSVFVPTDPGEGDADPASYAATALDVGETPQDVIDDLPEKLELVWNAEGEPRVTLEIHRYDAVRRTADFRLRRQSPPDAAIGWSNFSSGQCRGRILSHQAARAEQEGSTP